MNFDYRPVIKLPVLTFLALSFAGCSAIELRPGAEKVIVTHNAPPKTCKFLGAIVGTQGGALTGEFTSNKNLAQGAWNDMRNKALDLAANYVQLETDRAGVTGTGTGGARAGGPWMGSYSSQQTDVTQVGNAYKCNPKDIGLE